VRKGGDKKEGALWPQGSLSQCQCEVSRSMSWSGRNSIYLQITASKGTGNTFPVRTGYWKPLVSQTSFPSVQKQGESEETQGRACGPQARVPRRRQGHLRPAGHAPGSRGFTEHSREVGTPNSPPSNILSKGPGH